MKVIIAGSRGITDYSLLKICMAQVPLDITTIISGGAKGVDLLGEMYATENNIPIEQYRPDWKKHGRRAGIMRNCVMGDKADATVCLWDGISTGTEHMIQYSLEKDLPVFVFDTTGKMFTLTKEELKDGDL